jgi:NADH-quinone oxidoreductase subunit G
MLELPGFDFETSDQVRAQALGLESDLAPRLDNSSRASMHIVSAPAGLERIADVPIYSSDALVRHAPALQHSADAAPPMAGLPTALWTQLGLREGDKVQLTQDGASVQLPARHEAALPATVVHVPAGHADTAGLGAMFGALTIAKV